MNYTEALRPQAEIMIFESIYDKCVKFAAQNEDHLPDGIDISSICYQNAKVLESGVQALAYNYGDVAASVKDLEDLPTQLHNLADPLDQVLGNIKRRFPNEIEAYIYYFAHRDDEQRILIKKIKEILKK